MIDRRSPVPMYYQIEKYIEDLIENKNLKQGDRIPSEREFTEQFQVSRMTVRQAVMDLVNAGILLRRKGKGTFVSGQRKIEKSLNGLSGFSEDMINRGMKPDSKLLDFQKIRPPASVVKRLSLGEGEEVYAIKRTRLADDRPMAIETTFIPASLVPGLTRQASNQSLYDYIEKECGLTIDHADQSLEAVLVTAAEAAILDVPKGSPVLLIERCAYLAGGKTLEYTRSLYRADRYKFMIRLPRE
ncbi:GntR family transcriptional regulator [Sporolactobacillus putidus]|uniref:Phosphonate metabolism transcriptional regulator PhnF n=1 Tax=Sporolactobacillus putidus TaxID=492735 RepID=A0A917S916_9BACL|nr:GntR family transcriptional regulator [Sporolactobacillus putidus]GGL62338.1 phosphonate metabolism transcriptional regulator PhnF [Sporolactobacillus putidus]